jgi:hypothetical protein
MSPYRTQTPSRKKPQPRKKPRRTSQLNGGCSSSFEFVDRPGAWYLMILAAGVIAAALA